MKTRCLISGPTTAGAGIGKTIGRLLLLLLLAPLASHAQVGIGASNPNASAALEIRNTGKGLLIPRMDSAARMAIASPATGLLVYQTSGRTGFQYYNGTAWQYLPNKGNSGDNLGNHTATQNLSLGANQLVGNGGSTGISINSAGNVGLGASNPGQKLEVAGSVFANGEGTGFLTDSQAPRVGLLKYSGHEGGIWRTSTQDFEIGRVSGSSGAAIASLPGSPATFATDLYVGGDGNVGLGTTTPAARLDVNGGLVLEETASPALTGNNPTYTIPANVSTVRLVANATAPTGTVALSSTAPAVGQHLTIYNGTTIPAMLSGQTVAAGVASNLVYSNGSWQLVTGADNLGNHTATQTLNLNSQRLLVPTGTSLGDSIGQVEVVTNVSTPSTALIARGQLVRRFSRAELAGYGVLPDDNSVPNDFGIWATAYREKGWAGFFSAGNPKNSLRWVGICQNPGYASVGSAIRIVDGTQGAGKVLTSNAIGYGTWQPITAAGGNFNLGTYYLVGNGGSTGLSVSSSGQIGIGLTSPFGRLSTSTSDLVASDSYGGSSTGSLNWQANQSAYATTIYNAGVAGSSGGLAVKIGNAGTAGALDISQGTTAATAGTSLFRVNGNGYVGIGTNAPFSQLANSPDNLVGSDGNGGNPGSLDWQTSQQGYAAMIFNAGTFANAGVLALKVANNATAGALDISRAASAGSAGISLFRVNGNGYVGIGTNNPGVPLDISGGASLTSSATYAYLNGGGAGSGYTATLNNVSLRATGRIVANEFNASSDSRLKRVIGRSNGARDLALLGQLRITDYQMRDRVQYGERQFKKVIAQEVEAIYPQAVTQLPGFLPDVYARASAVQPLPGDSLLALTLPAGLPTAAIAGQRLKLVGPAGEVLATLAAPAAASSRRLTVRGVPALAGQPVFVFGLEHPDVRAVDYEALAMLNVSATQELARQFAALQQRNAALEAQAATAGTRAAQADADHAALLHLQAQMTQLLGEQAAAQARR